jgi:hypothetical protein
MVNWVPQQAERKVMWLAAAVLLTTLSAFWPGPAAAGEADTLLQAAQAVEARRADAWLASTEAQLQPTQAQRPAFAAYAEAIRAQAQLKAEHRTAGLFVDSALLPSAPGTTLYGGPTSQQRTVFDFLAVTATGIGSNDPG